MLDTDVTVRNATYRLFVEQGRTTSGEVAAVLGRGEREIEASWLRLAEAHALVLHDGTTELRMLNPFSIVPTGYRVQAGNGSWYANCAWDAFGICAALHVDGRVETSCADCDDPISVQVVDQRPDDDSLVFHCLVPAARWWDDIGFT
jgi:hypothetical protein